MSIRVVGTTRIDEGPSGHRGVDRQVHEGSSGLLVGLPARVDRPTTGDGPVQRSSSCACGQTIVSADGRWEAYAALIAAHNASPGHKAWRKAQRAPRPVVARPDVPIRHQVPLHSFIPRGAGMPMLMLEGDLDLDAIYLLQEFGEDGDSEIIRTFGIRRLRH